ncbi:hypothetical protein JHK86_035038 [Glycine max]|nr:hypothetical protein JHK86_035038 [Glycine max]
MAIKIADDDNIVKCMIDVIRQHEVLSSIELYANIELNTLPTLIPQPMPHEPLYYSYPQSSFAHIHMSCSHVVVACKHAHHKYKVYIDPVYTLQSASNVYK